MSNGIKGIGGIKVEGYKIQFPSTIGNQLLQTFKDIDTSSWTKGILDSYDWSGIYDTIQSILDSIPQSSRDRSEIMVRFQKTTFPGINPGYRKDIELILRSIDKLEDADDYPEGIPWGAGQMLAFAALEGMIFDFLINQGLVIKDSETGESLIKRADFEGQSKIFNGWHSQDENGRHRLAHGKSLAYPTVESFYVALDNAVRVSESIESDSIRLSMPTYAKMTKS